MHEENMDALGRSLTASLPASSSLDKGRSGRVSRTRPSRRKLTVEQELIVQRHVRRLPASSAEGSSGLWNGPKVHGLVRESTGVELPDRTFRTYLQRWDLVPPRPLQIAYKSAPTAVKRWMSVDHPVIAAQAREVKAQLLWLDVYRMEALEPSVVGEGADDHMLFLSDNRGHSEWTIGAGYPGPDRIRWFLRQALRTEGRRIHLLVREQSLIDGALMDQWCDARTDELLLIPLLVAAK